MSSVNLRKVVLNAYGIPDDREYALIGPDWLGTERFDIDATYSPDTPAPKLIEMLQNMLKERFQLALHRETRQLPMYSLVVAKGGLKIHAVDESGERGRTVGGPGRLEANKITMQKFADLIARQAGLPVTNATGLQGVFDFTLEWSPSAGMRIDSGAPSTSEGASIFTAIQEQLGLKLESGKGPVEVLVIDKIEKVPTAN